MCYHIFNQETPPLQISSHVLLRKSFTCLYLKSSPLHYQHFGVDNYVFWGTVLCVVGCFETSLACIHYIPGGRIKSHQMFLNVPREWTFCTSSLGVQLLQFRRIGDFIQSLVRKTGHHPFRLAVLNL